MDTDKDKVAKSFQIYLGPSVVELNRSGSRRVFNLMFRYLTLIFLAFGAGNCIQAAEIGGVRCEYRVNPQGIDNPNPRLNWIILSNQRGDIQTAYRVLVASSRKLLAADKGDLWDSGQVQSSQSVCVKYAGKPLSSRVSCFWKVRIWDRDGQPSQWSPPASWSMGLLNPSDWSAQWVSDPLLADPANRPLTPIHCYRSEPTSRPDATKWIVLDLATNQRMDAIDIIPARPQKERWDFRTPMFPLRFKVEAASNADFGDAKLIVDQTGADFPNPRSASCRFSFAPTTARYVRLTVTRLACWDAQDYGLALGGLKVFAGQQSIAAGARVECSDSMGSQYWSKRFLVDGEAAVTLTDAPALAGNIPDVPAKSTVSRVPMLRREFNVTGKIRRATLFVSARGFYQAHINGKKVGDELLAPGYTDYDARLQYQTYDVTRLLHRGPNALGALLGYGWYAGHINLADLRCIYGYFPQFLAQLEIELADGTRMTVGTDRQWRSTLDGPVRWSDLLDGEGYDCRREMPGWDKPGFDDRDWAPVWTQPRNEVPLVSQFCQPVRKICELRPASVKEVKPGVYVYDFGQEITGWCRLKATGPDGTHVRLRHSEMVAPDGNLDVKNLWGVPQQEDYILDGHGARVLEPHFTYHGFRYVELTGLPGGGLPPGTLIAVNIRSDLPTAGHFECSNALYNRIQRAAFWTQANLLFDVPNGCAARGERLAWTGDIRPCVQSLLFNFDAAAFLTKYTRDLRDDQSADGRFTDICPLAHLLPMGAPGWADAGVSLPWQLYVNTGDQTTLAEHFDAARRWVDFVHSNNPDLLWRNKRGSDWGDWLSAGPATPKEIGATAFFAHSADLVARMARVLGGRSEAEYYGGLFQEIRRAFANNYVNTNGIIGDHGDVQGSYALALQFDLLDEPLKSRAVARLAELVKENKFHPTTGFWSSVELLLALSANGCNDEAARMLAQETVPSWGYMAIQGTTLWESFDANARNQSLNHWTHSAVNEWLWRNVAGLNPDEQSAGYQTFTIYPRPTAEVSWCRSTYPSIRGQIVSNWRRDGNTFHLETVIPANTTATVILPAVDPGTVEESGKPAAQAAGVKQVSAGAGTVNYHVGSGHYHFTSHILPISAPITLNEAASLEKN
jgi:alpha-L-rhamnosidase